MEINLETSSVLSDYYTNDNNLTTNNLSKNNSYWWNLFHDQKYLRHSPPWTITLIIAYCLVFVIGFIGNSMVISVVVLRPKMRTVTNMFIMNLAVADLFVIFFCLPATLLSNVFKPWILGSVMCKGVGYVQGVSVFASAGSLAAISVDRCKAIYRPMQQPAGFSKSQALSIISLIWVIALLVTLPWAAIFDVITTEPDHITYCVECWDNQEHGKIYFILVNLILCYSLPLVVISISNVGVCCNVSNRKVPQEADFSGDIKRMHRRTRQGMRKMLGCVTFIFLMSWLPLYIIVTRLKFANVTEKEANVYTILLPFAQWLGAWNSCINPVLYAFLNQKFREMFVSLLPSWIQSVFRGSSNNLEKNATNNKNNKAGFSKACGKCTSKFTTTGTKPLGRSNNDKATSLLYQNTTKTIKAVVRDNSLKRIKVVSNIYVDPQNYLRSTSLEKKKSVVLVQLNSICECPCTVTQLSCRQK